MTPYPFRWGPLIGLLILGVTGTVLAAMFADAARSRASAPVQATILQAIIPDGPRVPVVVPKTVLLPAQPIDFSMTLPLDLEIESPERNDEASRRTVPDAPDAKRIPAVATPPAGPATSVETSAPDRPDAAPSSAPSSSRPTEPADSPLDDSNPVATDAQSRADAQRAVTATVSGAVETETTEQQRSSQPTASTPAVGPGGLVIDETMSPHGRTFYTAFFGVWQAPPVHAFYTIRVQEKPTPGRGTLVQVFVNDDVTFQTRLQPQTPVKEVALQAARRTYAYVLSGRGILQIY